MHGQLGEMKSAGEQAERAIILNTGQLRVAARNAQAAQDSAASAKRQVAISQQVYEASSRPYVGIERVDYVGGEKGVAFTTVVRLKNFGATPATNTEINRRWYMDGAETQHTPLPSKRGIFFPTVERQMIDIFPDVQRAQLDSGKVALSIRVDAEYRWAGHKYKYCEEFSYSPIIKGFAMLDDCMLTTQH